MLLRKMAPGVALLFVLGVACAKTTPTTSTVIASPPPAPSTSPSASPSPTLTQQQAIDLIAAMTNNVDNLNALSGYLNDLNKSKTKKNATTVNTSMSQLKASASAYKQENWDTTGQLFSDFSAWNRATFSFTNDVANSKGTSQYASWSKKATQLANQGNTLKAKIANATGLGNVPPPPSPSSSPTY